MSLWWKRPGCCACALRGVKCEEGEEEQGDWGFCGICRGEGNGSGRKGVEKRREGLVGGRKSADRSSMRRLSLAWEREKEQQKDGRVIVAIRRADVTESTIIATIHCLDVRYCLFRNPLVTHISYHVPSLLL